MAERNDSAAFATSDLPAVNRYARPRPMSSDTSGRAGSTPTGQRIERESAPGALRFTAPEKVPRARHRFDVPASADAVIEALPQRRDVHRQNPLFGWHIDPDGGYVLLAEGLNERGEPCAEKPQKLLPDGRPYPVEGLAGLTCVTSRPDANTVRAEVRREDGSLAGEGIYIVAEDGRTMTATTVGFDSQLRRFEMRTAWDRA